MSQTKRRILFFTYLLFSCAESFTSPGFGYTSGYTRPTTIIQRRPSQLHRGSTSDQKGVDNCFNNIEADLITKSNSISEENSNEDGISSSMPSVKKDGVIGESDGLNQAYFMDSDTLLRTTSLKRTSISEDTIQYTTDSEVKEQTSILSEAFNEVLAPIFGRSIQRGVSKNIIMGSCLSGVMLSFSVGFDPFFSFIIATLISYLSITPGLGGDIIRVAGEATWEAYNLVFKVFKKFRRALGFHSNDSIHQISKSQDGNLNGEVISADMGPSLKEQNGETSKKSEVEKELLTVESDRLVEEARLAEIEYLLEEARIEKEAKLVEEDFLAEEALIAEEERLIEIERLLVEEMLTQVPISDELSPEKKNSTQGRQNADSKKVIITQDILNRDLDPGKVKISKDQEISGIEFVEKDNFKVYNQNAEKEYLSKDSITPNSHPVGDSEFFPRVDENKGEEKGLGNGSNISKHGSSGNDILIEDKTYNYDDPDLNDEVKMDIIGKAAREAVEQFDNRMKQERSSQQELFEINDDLIELGVPHTSNGRLATLKKMTVLQLKAELRRNGLKVSGRKAELVERLNEYNRRT